MEIRPIEERAYMLMKLRFEKFIREMEELCADNANIKEWLTNQDVCLLLDIGKRTLQFYRDSGKLPFSQIGNKCFYKTSDIQKLIGASRHE